ncbi:MAG: hypothetical protein P8J44_08920, partial [Gammaproteobacteria bacterium]|nr:hypothetical protein [Gammaproteobacteria bacterium]
NGPIPDPVMLSRNGRRLEYTGNATIRSGAEVRVETGRDSLSLSLSQMDNGSSVIFELPGFTTPAGGRAQNNLDALRQANESSYYKDEESLWVKLVVDNASSSIEVIR